MATILQSRLDSANNYGNWSVQLQLTSENYEKLSFLLNAKEKTVREQLREESSEDKKEGASNVFLTRKDS